ncbi:MAG: fasciclin domain-containing protein [Prevotella sp.]|nr:fasciclin domain-containing protein [Prevotella sp.]
MKRINNNRILRRGTACCGIAAALTALSLTACSDWTDHYQDDSSILDSQQKTLWENIEQNENLTQFASLLKKVSYDYVLNTSQTYTVWAPANGTFDFDTYDSYGWDRLENEFVRNHIARNNYPASGQVDERVITLNEKMMHFGGNGNYSIQDINITRPNLASRNGVIHQLGGGIPFKSNIFESLNSGLYPLDSIADFFRSNNVKKLNVDKSVVGPTENGRITYLDSVFDEHNTLFTRFQAFINREDSNYTMLVPTNKAWHEAREKIEKYYNYFRSFEFMENTSTTEQKKESIIIKDVDYLRDSIVYTMLLSDLFYNNNIYDNRKLNTLQTGERLQVDSLYSTMRTKVYAEDAARLFEGAIRQVNSNGAAWVTDSLRMRSWTTWNPEIIVEGENSRMLASTLSTSDTPHTYVAPETQNPEISGKLSNNSYMEVLPISQSTNPGVVFYLPDVRSTTYSIYIVMVPANIVNPNNEVKPNRFTVTLGSVDSNGKNQDRIKDWTVESTFQSDTTKIDTIYLGDYTFPMAYFGTGNYYPYMRINSSVTNKERMNYDRILRIDCLILRPKELDLYLKEHPDYKYDKGLYNN